MEPFDYNNEKYHLGHFIMDSLGSRPDAICQIDAATGESETNASVLCRSVQLARCLRHFGIQPGDVLALGGRNHLDLHIPYYAALLNGMPIAGVDPLFKYLEIKAHFEVSSPKIVFCQKEHLEDNLRAINDLGIDAKLICFDDGEYSMKRFIEQYDVVNEDKIFTPLDFDLEKIYAWLVSTSGTTGVLKLAAFKHKKIIDKILELKQIFGSLTRPRSKLETGLPSLQLSPVQWISAFFNLVSFPLLRQIKITTSAPCTADHVIDIINEYKPDNSMIAPALATAIINSKKECDLTCFRSIALAGSKIHKDVYLELKKRMRPGAVVVEIYGQTENMGALLIPNPTGPIGNCGLCSPTGGEIKLVDPETGREITEPHVPGEMWTKGNCLSEYYNNPEETANVFTDDGWYKTGDILYKDEQGNYFFVERLKMLFKCRGYLITASVLEAIIHEHPDVEDVSVTSIPHKDDGQHPVACVVKRKGTNITAQEIKDLVADKLSESQQLRGGVVFMDELPLTSTGKVAREKLRQMIWNTYRE